jgi:hypothetical protein
MILKLFQTTQRETKSEFVIETDSLIGYFYDSGYRHLILYATHQPFKFHDTDSSHPNWEEFVDAIKQEFEKRGKKPEDSVL